MFYQPLGFLNDHLCHLHVPLRLFIKGGADHLCLHRPLHVRHLFRPLINEKDYFVNTRIIGRDTVCNVLEQHGLPCPGRGDDESSLAFTQGGHQVHNPR